MIGDGETVSFIPYRLKQFKSRVMAVKYDGIGLTGNENFLIAFSQTENGQRRGIYRDQGINGTGKLSFAAISASSPG